jgi:hypothetical protein
MFGLVVDLGDERASGIDHLEVTFSGYCANLGRNPVGRENDRGAKRDIGNVLDKDYALIFKTLDHPFVVDDGMADIKRRSVDLESKADDLNGKSHPGTKSARGGQDDLFQDLGAGDLLVGCYRRGDAHGGSGWLRLRSRLCMKRIGELVFGIFHPFL